MSVKYYLYYKGDKVHPVSNDGWDKESIICRINRMTKYGRHKAEDYRVVEERELTIKQIVTVVLE